MINRIVRAGLAALALVALAAPALAQLPPASGVVINQTPVQGGSAGQCLFISSGKVSSQACGGAPSGTAGGDLTGTYPNPTLGSGSASVLNAGTLASARGGAGTITGALKGNGAGVVSQAACADLSNAAASCATDATNATNLGSGTLGAARMPALTGDTTTSVGAVATTTTKINGVDQTTGWTTFSPTVTCGTGAVSTYTLQNGKYKTLGKTIFISINVQVNNANTCSGTITIASLPVTAGSNNYYLLGRDQSTGNVIVAQVPGAGTSAQVWTYNNANPGATDLMSLGGVYETN